MGKGVRLQLIHGRLKPCPKCGKLPKVYRDIGYETSGFGAWCTIECKPLFGKPHFKVEEGKARWENAFEHAVAVWNGWADRERRDEMTFSQFKKWCDDREQEGNWPHEERKMCLAVLEQVSRAPLWKRSRIWNKVKNGVIHAIARLHNETRKVSDMRKEERT